jgi:putative endopeptidase
MDPSVSACTNFFAYANGGWLAANPVPADRSSWGSFDILAERGLDDLRTLLEQAQAATSPDTNQAMVGALYRSAMQESRIEAQGIQPMQPELARIAALQTPAEIAEYLIAQHAQGDSIVFGVFAAPDFNDADLMIAYASQGGLGLPDRDYYLKTDADSATIKSKYLSHIQNMLMLAGEAPASAEQAAARVLAFESQLAEASLSRVERRDPINRYRMRTLAEANADTPNFDWSKLFAASGQSVSSFSLPAPKFFQTFGTMLKSESAQSWRDYLRWNALRGSAAYLSKPFVDESFAFYGKTLRGAQEQRVRWKRMVELTSGSLGEPLGQLYVAKHFPPAAKAQALALIDDLRVALKARLENLAWMSDATKREALSKLSTFRPKIGYPDVWRDFSGLNLSQDDLLGNMRAIAAFEHRYRFARIGKPTNREEWAMSPQTVNAYYASQANEIVFPAAILQPPFFDPNADMALNYGGIGAVIGHELLHGFDDQGSKFDAKGLQRNWWTADDRKRFEERTAKLDQQASKTVVADLPINGKLTMGENIADLGGVTIAYDALKVALARAPQPLIDGFSQEQRFFLSWAQIWRRNMRPEALKVMINTDPHAPPSFRVNGPLGNKVAFAEAFGCKANDAMMNPERVEIW